jgi:hypothetical protein
MRHRFLLVAAAALALAACGKSATENELTANFTPLDENTADSSLGGIVEIPTDDSDAPSENALLPLEKNGQ